MAICQTLAVWAKCMTLNPVLILMDPSVLSKLELLPVTLCYCADGLVDTLCQNSHSSDVQNALEAELVSGESL